MSSLFGHALIGASLGYPQGNGRPIDQMLLGAYFAFLSELPDLDYLVFWFGGYEVEPRYTHSIGFCLFVSALVMVFNRYSGIRLLKILRARYIVLAPISHLILDYLVGVHKSPFLWPLSSEVFAFKIGILPSAGGMSVFNYYFWRNLLIETAILLPIAIYVAFRNDFSKISILSHFVLIGLIITGCMLGLDLRRM